MPSFTDFPPSVLVDPAGLPRFPDQVSLDKSMARVILRHKWSSWMRKFIIYVNFKGSGRNENEQAGKQKAGRQVSRAGHRDPGLLPHRTTAPFAEADLRRFGLSAVEHH